MNNYVCEYINNDGAIREMCVKACNKNQARSTVHTIVRNFGYPILLKNINVLYIDNNRKPVNV